MDERLKEIEILAVDVQKYVHRTDYGDWIDHGIEKLIEADIPFLLDTTKRLTEERDLFLKQNKLLTRNNVDYRDEVARLKVENARLQDALTVAGKRIDSYQD